MDIATTLEEADPVDEQLGELESRLAAVPEALAADFESLRDEIDQLVADVEQQIAEADAAQQGVNEAHDKLAKEIEHSTAAIAAAVDGTRAAAVQLASTCVAADVALEEILAGLNARYTTSNELLLTSIQELDQAFHRAEPQWGEGMTTFVDSVAAMTRRNLTAGASQMSNAHLQQAEQHLQAVTTEVLDTVGTLGAELATEQQRFTQSISSRTDSHVAAQMQRIQRAIACVQQAVERMQSTVTTAASLIENGIETTSTIAEQMDGANVGLKVTVGTVSKMKNVLEELI
jgi:hypothetical protein